MPSPTVRRPCVPPPQAPWCARGARTLALVCLFIGWTAAAAAQPAAGGPAADQVVSPAASSAAARPIRRIEVSVGGGLPSSLPMGEVEAHLRPATGAGTFRLFTTDTELTSAPFAEVRVGTSVTRRFGAEVRVAFNQPELRTSVTGDSESAPPLTVVQRIDQYVVEAGVLVMLDELRLGAMVPFVTAGAGYLRQLHEGRTVVDEGHLFHAGGGVKHWLFSRPGALRAAGLRADGRVSRLVGGYALDEGPRHQLGVSGGFFLVF